MDSFFQLEILVNVMTAAFLGGIIGWEREASHISAGLRTHMLIAASAATIVSLGFVLIGQSETLLGDAVRGDPVKLFEAIVVGVGFIGGGIIFRDKDNDHVRNLTTAASILVTAGIGIAVALHQFYFATGLTVLVFVINHVLYQVEKKYIR